MVVAVGTQSGELIEATDWPAGYRHGETLLPAVAAFRAVTRQPNAVPQAWLGLTDALWRAKRVEEATAAARDAVAARVLGELFPNREIVTIDCTDLIWGLGAFHCLTQQVPQ